MSLQISQSLINDVIYNGSKELEPASCPLYIKRRYVDKWQTPDSELMLAGRYFEWHLLGATRDMIEPIIPRINKKKLSPTSTTKKEDMSAWLEKKGIFLTGTKEALYERIKEFPAEYSEGDPSTRQIEVDAVIAIAKQVLEKMGLDTTKGKKQVKLTHKDTEGHIDWIAPNFISMIDEDECIIDVKYTETKVDDRYNGWADFQERSDIQVEKAKTQAGQYTKLYFETFGKWVPYYFFIFGRSGWVNIIKMTILESGLADITFKQEKTRDILKGYVKSNWKAKPEYNKCIECPFAAYDVKGDGSEIVICPSRSITPTITEVQF